MSDIGVIVIIVIFLIRVVHHGNNIIFQHDKFC